MELSVPESCNKEKVLDIAIKSGSRNINCEDSIKVEPAKFYEVEVKGETEHYVEGYISTSDLDLVNDIVTKECMEDMLTQIKSGSIKLDFNHDTIKEENLNKNPTGRIVDAKLDSKGIWVKALINKFYGEFKSLWGSIKSGMIDAFSIAYQPIKKTVRKIKGKAVRFLEKVKLVNVALTGTPVNPNAKMTNIFAKSMDFYKEIENKGLETKGINTKDLINLFKTFTDLLEKSNYEEVETPEIKELEEEEEATEENKTYVKNTEETESVEETDIKSHSTSVTEEKEKMVEEMKPTELEKTEALEETTDKKEEVEQPEVKAEESKDSEDKSEAKDEEEKEEDDKKLTEKKSLLEAEVKALEDKKAKLEKELSKPEFKSLAESSPKSIKSNNTNRVNPLSLFA